MVHKISIAQEPVQLYFRQKELYVVLIVEAVTFTL